MRFRPKVLENLSGDFYGEKKSIGRVTVEPTWSLKETPPLYGGNLNGPFRWFQSQSGPGLEWEVPNVKSITIDRSESQDLATCEITIYNTWHEGNLESAEDNESLGKRGYFWPKRGMTTNRWGQVTARGAFDIDGTWSPSFSWQDVLVQYGLIRTYEGFGEVSSDGNYVPLRKNINEEEVLITGTWLIDTITAGSDGTMTLSCKDMGKLLLEQLAFPPTIPLTKYPVDYYPAGKSPFDSYFGAKPHTGVSPASFGEVRSVYHSSSLDAVAGSTDASVGGHSGSHAVDGDWKSYSLSEGYSVPVGGIVWWQFGIGQHISKISFKPWAGGYNCYVSIHDGTGWLGSENVPGQSVKYVTKLGVPHAVPDGMESVVHVDLPQDILAVQPNGTRSVNAQYVRIWFTDLYYSGISGVYGGDYRGGIRDLKILREGVRVNPYTPDFETLPWTYAMASHPTRGYWVADSSGHVYGFGDAADYDATVYLAPPDGEGQNMIRGMCAHPSGRGGWTVDTRGRVAAFGLDAVHHGEYLRPWAGSQYWGGEGIQAWDITPTHTGNGYWVIYGDGLIKAFGDAVISGPHTVDAQTAQLPWTNVGLFMNALVHEKWLMQRNGNGICGHPTKMGFWAVTGSGEVYAFGEAKFYGQLHNRVFNDGMADAFRLMRTEFTRSIETTTTGDGYWMAFGSGRIAAFGDAVGQGPSYIYPNKTPGLELAVDEYAIEDFGFYRALVWDLARDPDGTGFWVLVADGSVKSYNAEFWGQPGYSGLTGYRWHEGNYTDYSDIIKDLLAWSGWTFYTPGATSREIYGEIESTGIKSDTAVTSDKFDKRPILDIIKELCEITAYDFRIREDGGVKIASRNIWRAGNFDEDGLRIYVNNDGERVSPETAGAKPFIPVIDEKINLFDYRTTLDSSSMRSEIIIGTDQPDPKHPSRTGFSRFTPMSAKEEVSPGIKLMRGIPRPAMWISSFFANEEEVRIMAELISLNAWFAERISNLQCIANPALQIGDQIKIYERNTSEDNIHYITGINTVNDRESGEYVSTLTTHWLGTDDDWVITADNVAAPVNGRHYIQISERVDRWQQATDRGLVSGGLANGGAELAEIISISGKFQRSVLAQTPGLAWVFDGEMILRKRYTNLGVTLSDISAPLGDQVYLRIYNSSGVMIMNKHIAELNLPYVLETPLGQNGMVEEYRFELCGFTPQTGNGYVKMSFDVGGEFSGSVEGSCVITSPERTVTY